VKRALLVGAVLVVLGLVIYNRPWEPHISSGAVERELLAEYATGARSADCHGRWSLDSPESQGLSQDDWDYTCTVVYGPGDKLDWWIGTNWHHITEVGHEGP
jgi:hypothetical protein